MARRLPKPRWRTPLPAGVVGSWGPDVAAVARRLFGIELDRWQRVELNRALVYGEDRRLLHRLYLLSVARQNGKTSIVRALIDWALTASAMPEWSRLLGLAHDRGQARLPYELVLADLEPLAQRVGPASRGGLNVTRYLGIRSGMHGRRREYHIGSREAADQVRSTSNDLALFDEVLTQRDHRVWAALEPTTTARPEPLIVATSTAGDDRSVLLREWWERMIRIVDGAEPMRDFGASWYASSERYPASDPRSWREANPAVAEGRIAESVIASAGYNAGGFDTSLFRSERLNLWAEAVDEWLPPGIWARQDGPQPEQRGRVVLGVEVPPSWRRASVVVAVASGEGAWLGMAGELDASRPRPSGLTAPSIAPTELIELVASVADTWSPDAIAFSVNAAAAPHLEAWALEADVASAKLGARELRSASELFRSELIGGRLTHSPDPILAFQTRQVRPSHPIEGGAWYLAIRGSTGEVDAIRAAAWAAWAAISPAELEVPLQIFVPE